MAQTASERISRRRTARSPLIRIGISGWTYPPWRGTFYPKGLAQHRELAFASRQVNSIEINGSFYSLQRPSSYLKWYDAAPADFVFSVKANRFITHIRRLRDIHAPLANFFASGVLALREKLGPVLWQFPPSMKYDPERFETFLRLLPRTRREARELALDCDDWLKDRGFFADPGNGPVFHVIEVRNATFENADFIRQLRNHDVSLVVSDSGGKWPYFDAMTGPVVYARLHGAEELYASGYTPEALDLWAERIRRWRKTARRIRPVFVYFDNDAKVHAPFDAVALHRRLTDFRPAAPMPKFSEVSRAA